MSTWWVDCRWGVQTLWRTAPGLLLAAQALQWLLALWPMGLLWLQHRVWQPLLVGQPPVWWALAGVVVLFCLLPWLQQSRQWIQALLAGRVQAAWQQQLYQRVAALPLQQLDRGSSYDLIHRIRADLTTQPLLLIEHSGALLQGVVTLLVLAGALAHLSLYWLLGPALSAGLMLALGLLMAWRRVLHQRRLTRLQRQVAYLGWLMTDRQSAADLRLFDLGDYFCRRLQQAQQALLRLQTRQETEAWWASLAASLLLAAGGIWLGWQSLLAWQQGALSAAALVVGAQGLWFALRSLGQLVESALKVARAGLFLREARGFLQPEPATTSTSAAASASAPCPAPQAALCLQQVTFAYADHAQPVVQDFSLTIPAGQVVVLMGSNGAGKSTLLRLLAGLYIPQQGQVWLQGQPLHTLNAAERSRRLALLQQEPARFQTTLAENIELERGFRWVDRQSALETAGVMPLLAHLPQQAQTLLGRQFGGSELSGGQWQRLCLARVLAGEPEVILLDEPTSALDGWAERDWFSRMRAWAAGRTLIVVTHRVQTARHADRIIVLEGGQVVEEGDHASLLAQGGRYAAAWQSPEASLPDVSETPAGGDSCLPARRVAPDR